MMSDYAGRASNFMSSGFTKKCLPVLFFLLCAFSSAHAQGEKKTAYAVLIDNTGSLRSQFDRVKSLAKGVVQDVHKRGRVSLFNFKADMSPKVPLAAVALGEQWSQDAARLETYIDALVVEQGQTTLFDAIDSVGERLNARAELEKDSIGRKVIVLISDGEDRVSKLKRGELIDRLKKRGIEVYAIGLIGELDDEGGFVRKSKRETAKEFLTKMTKETGGMLLLPKAKDTEVEAFTRALVGDK